MSVSSTPENVTPVPPPSPRQKRRVVMFLGVVAVLAVLVSAASDWRTGAMVAALALQVIEVMFL